MRSFLSNARFLEASQVSLFERVVMLRFQTGQGTFKLFFEIFDRVINSALVFEVTIIIGISKIPNLLCSLQIMARPHRYLCGLR